VLRRGTRSSARTGTPADLLVVGIGNPGEEYSRTRHNVGAEVVDILARRHGGRLRKSKELRAIVDEVRVNGRRLALAVPTTYMNDSGQAVAPLARRFGVEPDHLVVVHDELDLPTADLRVKLGGGMERAGTYFPHDEFYDASMRDTINEIGRRARPSAHVASESPLLASYYAQRENHGDLVCVSLSDPDGLKQLGVGDFVIVARGRRYFSNDQLISSLASTARPDFQMFLGKVPSVDVYVVTEASLQTIKTAAQLRASAKANAIHKG